MCQDHAPLMLIRMECFQNCKSMDDHHLLNPLVGRSLLPPVTALHYLLDMVWSMSIQCIIIRRDQWTSMSATSPSHYLAFDAAWTWCYWVLSHFPSHMTTWLWPESAYFPKSLVWVQCHAAKFLVTPHLILHATKFFMTPCLILGTLLHVVKTLATNPRSWSQILLMLQMPRLLPLGSLPHPVCSSPFPPHQCFLCWWFATNNMWAGWFGWSWYWQGQCLWAWYLAYKANPDSSYKILACTLLQSVFWDL